MLPWGGLAAGGLVRGEEERRGWNGEGEEARGGGGKWREEGRG